MPSRNVVKQYENGAFYHVYNRGVNKRLIFLDDYDYRVFLNLFKRYLDEVPCHDQKGREYPWLRQRVSLLAYCLMPNHFHALVRQDQDYGITKLFQSLTTSYVTYFNKRHGRVGRLFQGPFKASRISSDSYLQHVSRYIHLNPADFETWPYSSYKNYLGLQSAPWLLSQPLLEIFQDDEYGRFVADYAGQKAVIDELKRELADH